MSRIVYIIESRLFRFNSELYLSDSNYLENVNLFLHSFSEVILIASVEDCDELKRVSYKLCKNVRLIEVGNGSFLKRKLELFRAVHYFSSYFFYTDDFFLPFFIKIFTKKSKIFLELRNYSLFNIAYNIERFNVLGFFTFATSSLFLLLISKIVAGLVIIDYLPKHLSFFFRGRFVLLPDNYSQFRKMELSEINSEHLNLLFVGNLEKVKRVDWSIKLIADLKQSSTKAKLKIVGTGPELCYLQNLAKSLGVIEDIQFIGSVKSNIILDEIYSLSDVLLVTSITETGPRVIPEALKNGCQVFMIYVGFYAWYLDTRCVTHCKDYNGFKRDFFGYLNLHYSEKREIYERNARILQVFSRENNLRRRSFIFKYLLRK